MPISLKYTGAVHPYFETAVTGKPQAWRRGSISSVSDADAALLLATGLFVRSLATIDDNADSSDGSAGLSTVESAAVRSMVLPDGNLQYPSTTAAAFAALVAASGLRINAVYNVDGVLYKATSANAYTAAAAAFAQYASLPLTAGSVGQRQAVGGARQLSLTSAGGGSIYYRFVDASGAIVVSSSDSSAALSTTAVALTVPSGSPFLEYLRVGGADITFTANLLA